MKIMSAIIFLFLAISNSFAQKITVKQKNETIGNGINPALVVTIYDADIEEVEKEWKSLMKGFNAKVTMGGEIFADNAKIKGFENACDVYARIKSISDTERELTVAVDLGGAYLSGKQPSQQKKMENLLYDFAVKLTKAAIATQVKEAEKAHKKMIKEQENLAGEKEQLQKDILNYKNKITEAEKAIVENDKSQEAKKTEIEKQQKLVEQIKERLNAVK